jgi:hypothetical protein
MTRQEADTLWFQAMNESIKDGEQFTRYHFADLVAAHEREACAQILDQNAAICGNNSIVRDVLVGSALAIRARETA